MVNDVLFVLWYKWKVYRDVWLGWIVETVMRRVGCGVVCICIWMRFDSIRLYVGCIVGYGNCDE